MNRQIRAVARRLLPKPVLIRGWEAYCRLRARRARAVFEAASAEPAYLGWDELHRLQHAYPPAAWDYHYDPESLAQRGRERARLMVDLVGREEKKVRRFLDLGAWDGMCCAALREMGKEAVGIDIRSEGFTAAAAASGVSFIQMDAAALGFVDNSFDYVFSFNSFEHFPDPEQVLQEAIRVLRPGGYLYLDFGPLWWSPKGAHQFRTIHVPYNQCLFSKELLTEYADAQGIELMGFFWMNEWTVEQYRQLWSRVACEMEMVRYYETYNADHVDLITRYPSCFRNKSDNFDNFIVAYMELLMRKKS